MDTNKCSSQTLDFCLLKIETVSNAISSFRSFQVLANWTFLLFFFHDETYIFDMPVRRSHYHFFYVLSPYSTFHRRRPLNAPRLLQRVSIYRRIISPMYKSTSFHQHYSTWLVRTVWSDEKSNIRVAARQYRNAKKWKKKNHWFRVEASHFIKKNVIR